MAKVVPSDEDIRQAVERHMAERRIAPRLSTAEPPVVTRGSVLECRIDRSIEDRVQRPGQRAKGPLSSNRTVADRPTYTVLSAYPVTPPADPSRTQVVSLVLAGSLDEEPCGDCVGGKKDCATCGGQGGAECPRWIECEVCRGGPDACWECDGTGTPRTRRARAAARPRREGTAARAAECRRCAGLDVACPGCRGEWKRQCPACHGKGFAPCEECAGAKRFTHKACDGTGWFTVWTGGLITHTPDPGHLRPVYPPFTRLRTGDWREARLTGAGAGAGAGLPDFLDDADVKRLASLLAVRDGEVGRRVTVRRLALARVETSADPDRVYYVYPALPDGLGVIHRPSRQRVTAFAWAAAAVIALAVTITLTVLW